MCFSACFAGRMSLTCLVPANRTTRPARCCLFSGEVRRNADELDRSASSLVSLPRKSDNFFHSHHLSPSADKSSNESPQLLQRHFFVLELSTGRTLRPLGGRRVHLDVGNPPIFRRAAAQLFGSSNQRESEMRPNAGACNFRYSLGIFRQSFSPEWRAGFAASSNFSNH
jgi:hypothetical protein